MFRLNKGKSELLKEKIENLEEENDIYQRKLRNEKNLRLAAEEVI